MSLLQRVVLPTLTVLGLAFLIACSSSNNNTPPPSGGFSNTDFNGTYVFSILGADQNGELAIAGAITACGCSNGSISAGTVDLTDSSGASGPIAITTNGSGYSVNKDGTGTFKLALPLSSGSIQYQFAFALTDAAHGVISEYDENGSGSGTIDLQQSPGLSNGSYAFSLSGTTNEEVAGEEEPVSLGGVGAFTLSSSSLTGTDDFNLDGTIYSDESLTGSISAGSGTTQGSAAFASANFATQNFDVYAIDANHLKLIETDSNAVFVGDLFSQTAATMPSGNLSFTMSGLDGTGNPLAVGGTFTSDGSANFGSGTEVINDNGNITTSTSPFSGTFPAGNTYGRFAVAMAGFVGGTNFAAYPSSGGLLMLEIDSSAIGFGVSEGVAMTQNSPAGVAASQGYALNLTGGLTSASGGGELDQIAQFNTGSSNLSSGTVYFNEGGTTVQNYGLNSSSSYTTSQVTLSFNGGSEGVAYFGVDSATSLALGIDTTDVSLGVIEQQGSPTSTADIAGRHLAAIKAAVKAHAKKKKQL